MAKGLSVKIDTSRLMRRMAAYHSNLTTLLQSEWPVIVQECLLNVLTRTPDPATEYAYIMGIEGGVGYGSNTLGNSSHGYNSPSARRTNSAAVNPRASSSISSDTSRPLRGHSAGPEARIRFIRTPGMWIQEAVMDPLTRSFSFGKDQFSVGLGNVAALEKLSSFSWVNYSKEQQESFLHTTEYGVWSFFEYGLSHLVQPRHWSGNFRGNTLGYKLKPTDTQHYWAMMKHYPKFGMYSGFQKQVFSNAVKSRISMVKF